MRRSGRDGMVQLDNSTAVRGSSLGPLLELNLEQPLYIGYVPLVSIHTIYIYIYLNKLYVKNQIPSVARERLYF